jgi:hypothetical protein
MNKLRFAPVGVLIAMVGYYLSSALNATAMPEPPEPVIGPGSGAAAVAPAQSIVVHDHVSAWIYALVVAAAIVATLLVVQLVSRLRGPKSPTPESTRHYRASFGHQDV